jgi:acetyl esterase/lipase
VGASAAATVTAEAPPGVPSGLICSAGAAECNIEYVSGGRSRHQVLDVFYAHRNAARRRPAIVFVHSGGWWGGDKTNMAASGLNAPLLAAGQGWVAFNIDYRLAPDPSAGLAGDTRRPYADQLADVTAAVLWVKAHAARYSIDPGRIALVGASAGGQLALLAGLTHAGRTDAARVHALVSWAGPTDLLTLASEHACGLVVGKGCGTAESTPVGEMVQSYEGNCTPVDCPNRYQSTSPVDHASGAAPPVLQIQGVADNTVPVEQANELDGALRANGATSQVAGCVVVDLAGWILPCNHFTLYAAVWQPTAAFLHQHL